MGITGINVFVIIVSYNGREWYDRCFNSVINSSVSPSVVVVDNHSSDDTVQYIKTSFPTIKIIQQDQNLGFGRANNIGLRYALENGCDYVFLLNQDAWVEPDCLELLIEQAEKNPDYGILSPVHLTKDKNHFEPGLLNYLSDNRLTDASFLEDSFFGRRRPIYESKFINAAGWLLPRKTLETVGGFAPIFKHYEEDYDYLNRVRYHSLKIGIVPSASMVHDHRENNSTDAQNNLVRERQYQLVQLIDLNKRPFLNSYLLYLLRKSIVLFIRTNFADVNRMVLDFGYFWGMRKRIKESRKMNAAIGTNWIF